MLDPGEADISTVTSGRAATRFLHWGCARQLVILLLAGAALLLLAGNLLIAEDPAQPSDAIIVIGGDHKPERVKRAVELYTQGYAPRVILSAGTIVPEGDESLAEAEVMRRQALALGLPEAAIVMETASRSTFENAWYSRALSRQYNFHSILLVTSQFHSARAKRIFQDVFGTQATVRLEPATAGACSVCWLFDPGQVYVVLYEYWNWLQYWASQTPRSPLVFENSQPSVPESGRIL